MSRDPALLDTNVLIDALYKGSDHYPAARALLEQAMQDDAAFCITPRGRTSAFGLTPAGFRLGVGAPG